MWQRWSSWSRHWRKCPNSLEKLRDWQLVPSEQEFKRQWHPQGKWIRALRRTRHRMERMVLHFEVCGIRGESRTSDGRCILRTGRSAGCRAHSYDEAQCETAVLSHSEHSQGESFNSCPKRRKTSRGRGMETYQDWVPARSSQTAYSNAQGYRATW